MRDRDRTYSDQRKGSHDAIFLKDTETIRNLNSRNIQCMIMQEFIFRATKDAMLFQEEEL